MMDTEVEGADVQLSKPLLETHEKLATDDGIGEKDFGGPGESHSQGTELYTVEEEEVQETPLTDESSKALFEYYSSYMSLPDGLHSNGSVIGYEYWRQWKPVSTTKPADLNLMMVRGPGNLITSAYSTVPRTGTVGSTRTFATARTSSAVSYRTSSAVSYRTSSAVSNRTSSVASYRTAPGFSHRAVPESVTDPFPILVPDISASMSYLDRSLLGIQPRSVNELVKNIITEAPGNISTIGHINLDSAIGRHIEMFVKSGNVSLASIAQEIEDTVTDICKIVFDTLDSVTRMDDFRGTIARLVLDYVVFICDLTYLADNLESYFQKISTGPLKERSPQVFSSAWLKFLDSRGLLLDSLQELNWSGRGQHVEYSPDEGKEIPLVVEKVIGHSASAIVESVKCRRIRLARKKIKCTRRVFKEDVIVEVEHLHKLQHAHILRFVGTYTFKKDLAILLYPVAPWNLEDFMDELLDTDSIVNSDVLQTGKWRKRAAAQGLRTAFGCLAHALEFIHDSNVKHMDIKPQNILVRVRGGPGNYRVYIADFGISRAYTSALDAETDTPTSFTRTYAPPEVVRQDTRGLKVDIYSLGCVFLEMVATLVSNPSKNERQKLMDIRKSGLVDASFNANHYAIQGWYEDILEEIGHDDDFLPSILLESVPRMIERDPDQRLTADQLSKSLSALSCVRCEEGPEPFEAAEDESQYGH